MSITWPDTGLRDAAELLRGAAEVTVLAHVQPDADALGSALALGAALRRRGAVVRVSFGAPDTVPESLRFLDTAGLCVPAAEVPPTADLLITADCASAERLGVLADLVPATIAARGSVLVVDHHVSNTRFGTHHLVDEHAEATALVALRLLDELGVALDEPIARCLYAGIATDTGWFRRASPEVHLIAARLLDAGVDAVAMSRALSGARPFAWLPMLSSVLDRARLEPAAAGGLGLVHAVVRLSDMAGVRMEEVESVVDIVRATAEAEVAAVLKEMAPGRWSVSLRATSVTDVAAVALRLGGGGHRQAAGFTAVGTAEEVLDRLRTALAVP